MLYLKARDWSPLEVAPGRIRLRISVDQGFQEGQGSNAPLSSLFSGRFRLRYVGISRIAYSVDPPDTITV